MPGVPPTRWDTMVMLIVNDLVHFFATALTTHVPATIPTSVQSHPQGGKVRLGTVHTGSLVCLLWAAHSNVEPVITQAGRWPKMGWKLQISARVPSLAIFSLAQNSSLWGEGYRTFLSFIFFALFIALKHMSAIASIVLLILFSEQAYFYYLLRASTVFDPCNTNPLANMKTGLLPFASWQRCIQFKWHINEPCMKLCILACTTNKPYSYVHCDVLLREVVNAPFLICCHDI